MSSDTYWITINKVRKCEIEFAIKALEPEEETVELWPTLILRALADADESPLDQLLARGVLVVVALGRLRGRRQDGLAKPLVLAQSVGQSVSTEEAFAALVGRPDRGRGHAGEVGAIDELDRQRPTLFHDRDVRIRNGEQVIARAVAWMPSIR